MSKPLPPVPHAKVEVVELGITKEANSAGEVSLTLKPGMYTFRATIPGSQYTSTLKHQMWEGRFSIFFDLDKDLTMDYATSTRTQPRGSAPKNRVIVTTPHTGISPQSVPIDPHIPSSITLWSWTMNQPVSYPLETYAKKAVAGEVNLGFYSNLTSAQELEMYKALALTSRSHVTYFTWATTGCGTKAPYKIDDSTNCQVVDHNYDGSIYPDQSIESAVSATASQIAIYVDDLQNGIFEYVAALFFASDNGTTKSSQAVYGTAHPYLVPVTDQYDEEMSLWVCTNHPNGTGCGSNDFPRVGGYYGPGVGLSHDGAAGYAQNGSTGTWIVTHFYNGVSIYTASVSTGP